MVFSLLLTNVTKITNAEIRLFQNTLYRSKSDKEIIEVRVMTVQNLKLNTNVETKNSRLNENADINPQPEFVDRSEMLFSYMNMVAFNNKLDLKLN